VDSAQTNSPRSLSGINPGINLRSVQAEDFEFLLEVYAATRRDEMGMVPWDDEQRRAFLASQFTAQQEHYRKTYPHAQHQIVLLGEEMAGRIYVARLDEEIRIIDLIILPVYRGRGIGGQLITRLQSEGSEAKKPLRVYVESFNPALSFFEKRGFKQIGEHGFHLLMERKAE